ncbi:NUDIX domain-containing protein [Streptomyces sp. NPDC005438]|uniref:NUDIX domain-containing protein n=1 Tax=Streptomyces sp. NPDC005438 TaxID=3156880 RepID=UPI0033BA6257
MSPSEPLAEDPHHIDLLSFHPVPEGTSFPDAPTGFALVALWHRGRALMVHVRARGCWELPGGGIEEGESERRAAVRELYEETGQGLATGDLRFVGYARTHRVRTGSLLYGALYTATLTSEAIREFTPHEEIADTHWYAPGEPLPPTARSRSLDDHLLSLCTD